MEQHQSPTVFRVLMGGKVLSAAIGAAANLNVAEALQAGPKTNDELAAATQTHAPSLLRMMRFLVSHGIFAQEADGRWALNEEAAALAENHPHSAKALAKWITSEVDWKPYANFDYSVRTGKPAFDKQYGMPIFDWFMTKDKETSEIFNAAMSNISKFESAIAVQHHDWSKYETVADVGGGHGGLLTAILLANPSIKKGIVYDLKHVVEGAASTNSQLDQVKDRLEFQPGSFFEGAPVADAYVLKHIIHDWGDDDCVKILSQIRKNIKKDGKVIILDAVIPAGNEPHFGKALDMEMLLMLSPAKERTEAEFADILKRAGFKLTHVTPNPVSIGVVVGEPEDA